jgi:hypothetical protein
MAKVCAAMQAAAQAFGHPHLHSGIGLRRIGRHLECRDALNYRLLFMRDGEILLFIFYGTHDQVRAFSKNQG